MKQKYHKKILQVLTYDKKFNIFLTKRKKEEQNFFKNSFDK